MFIISVYKMSAAWRTFVFVKKKKIIKKEKNIFVNMLCYDAQWEYFKRVKLFAK